MPVYEFKTPANTIVQCFYPAAEAPDIGAQVDINGVICTRIISTSVAGGVPLDDRPGIVTCGDDEPGRFETTEQGHTILKNKRDRRDFQKANPGMVPAREVELPPFNDFTERMAKQADAHINRKG